MLRAHDDTHLKRSLESKKIFVLNCHQTHGFMKLRALGYAAAELTHFRGQSLFGELRHRCGSVERLGHFAFAFHVIDVDVLCELLSTDVSRFNFHALFQHFYVQL